MIRLNRPGTLEGDSCRRAWITHPAFLHNHPSRHRMRPSAVESWGIAHGWNAEHGQHTCPRCLPIHLGETP